MDGTGMAQHDQAAESAAGGRRLNDAPLRAALENRRGRAFDEAISGVCYTHGVRLGLSGEPLPGWLATAPRWAREALKAGHASGMAIAAREKAAG